MGFLPYKILVTIIYILFYKLFSAVFIDFLRNPNNHDINIEHRAFQKQIVGTYIRNSPSEVLFKTMFCASGKYVFLHNIEGKLDTYIWSSVLA